VEVDVQGHFRFSFVRLSTASVTLTFLPCQKEKHFHFPLFFHPKVRNDRMQEPEVGFSTGRCRRLIQSVTAVTFPSWLHVMELVPYYHISPFTFSSRRVRWVIIHSAWRVGNPAHLLGHPLSHFIRKLTFDWPFVVLAGSIGSNETLS